MCGICGKIDFTGKPVEEGLVRAMAQTLTHRGPDDEGVYVGNGIVLGHRRLSVIDLSNAAHQPMANEDETLRIVYNGEVYNFEELKSELQAKGHRFRSHSDTEVILHLYEEEGARAVERLRGMFAFAIWDTKKKELFLARDRTGQKPLFYRPGNESFHFASEIKAILKDPDVKARPDLTAIDHYLTWQCVPAPYSAFEGIKKVPPAHHMTVKDGHVKLTRYWRLDYTPKLDITEEEIKTQLLSEMREAVKLRMISDVPLGAFLSGGVDSSAIVAFMAEASAKPIKTFAIGFKEAAYNELSYAKIIAERFKTDHTEFIVEPNALEILPKLVWHYGEPFADSSAIPTYYVSQLARDKVTVALNGDGGDESFAGYERYMANELSDRITRFLPKPLARLMLMVAMRMPHGTSPKNTLWRAKRFLQGSLKTPEMRNADWMGHFSPEVKRELYTDDLKEKLSGSLPYDAYLKRFSETDAVSSLDKLLYNDVNSYLPEDLLVKVDVASMASSLEARSPFLDHKFMEFAATIPSSLKLKGRTTKYILKEALRGILPDNILFRPKMGFAVPIDRWFKDELKEMAYDTLLSTKAIERGYFKAASIERILNEHVTGKWNWHHQIYNLLMLELWHREFID